MIMMNLCSCHILITMVDTGCKLLALVLVVLSIQYVYYFYYHINGEIKIYIITSLGNSRRGTVSIACVCMLTSISAHKCVSKTHIRQTRGGGSYNYVQHPRPRFKSNISVADCIPLSSLLKTFKLTAASNAGDV